MTDLFAARSQMAMSLGFHIIFAAVGVALPLLMVIAEALWLKTKDESYCTLAQQWAKGTAILFAVGAVSGTVLSFELGLLWPRFMDFAGALIGLPFTLEGVRFFRGGDLSRHLSLRLAARASGVAPICGCDGVAGRRRFSDLCGFGQWLDERAHRFPARRRQSAGH
jgi:Cytochrome bd terminal oxidase subunit I